MARDDNTGNGSDGGGGGIEGPGGSGGPTAGTSLIKATVPDNRTLLKIQQKLDASKCVSISRNVDTPDGGFEILVEAYCPEEVGRDVTEFIWKSLSERRDGGTRRDTPTPRERIALERIEARIARGESIAELVLNPPESFGAVSRDLAAKLAEKIQNYQFLGKTIVVGVLLILATATPVDTVALATQGFELEGVAEALQSLPKIAKAQIRQLIQQELATQPPRLPPREQKWWTDLDSALK